MRINNVEQGYQQLIEELEANDVEHIVCEATGGYEKLFIEAMKKAHFKTWIVNPSWIKAFIASKGKKAKTDKIDAKMIARFAVENHYEHEVIDRSDEENELRSLAKRRENFVQMIVSEKQRLGKLHDNYAKPSIKKHIEYMEAEKVDIEKAIDKILFSSKKLGNIRDILESVPGVGRIVATTLITEIPEMGTLTRHEIAALSGTAPYIKQSGAGKGYARTLPSRLRLRKVLHMGALVATRHNTALKNFYERLIKAGKKPIVAVTAVARKLIVMLNVMVKEGKKWEERSLPVIEQNFTKQIAQSQMS